MSVSQEDREYVRVRLKDFTDLLDEMIEVEAFREGLTVEEWNRRADKWREELPES